MDNVRKETHVVSVMTTLHKETCAVVTGKKDDLLLLHQIRRPRLTAREKNLQNNEATEMKTLQTKGAKIRARYSNCKIRHGAIGILPYVKTTLLRLDANMASSAIFDMLTQMRSPAKSQRKVVRKDQLLH